jgi:Acyl-CoA dehydrogenase, C-terminal domain
MMNILKNHNISCTQLLNNVTNQSRRKLNVVMVIICVHAAGGNGYINDYPVGRLLRDAKLYEIGAGTSEVRRLVIGRSINAEYK